MTDELLLKKAAEYQSFSPGSSRWNEYNGLDKLSIGSIQDNRLYALVHDGNLADLRAGRPSKIEYFFDQATYDKYVDRTTGKFDAKALSEALQVKPYQSEKMASTDGHAEYRNSIACFDRTRNIRTPVGTCKANTQFGGGGAHQAFIPAEVSTSLQENGILKYNDKASNIHTGQNYSIGADAYGKIQTASDERCINCEEKGLQHPEPEACQNGFELNPDVDGEPFGATDINNSAEYAVVIDKTVTIEEESPPPPHDLTSLQMETSQRFGMTAAETLAYAQGLYEAGLLSYPRTSSHSITPDMEETVASLLSDTEGTT